SETVDALKRERDQFKEDAEKLSVVTKERDKFKALAESAEKDPFKVKYEALKEDFENYKTEQKTQETAQQKNAAVKALLKEIGIADKRIDAVMKVTDTSGITLDENGKIEGASELKKSLKEEWSDFITTQTSKGAQVANPPANTGGSKLTRAEIYAKDEQGRYKLSTAERQKAIAENPDFMKG
ncbi:MAG: phage scaffolding protein, partial [Clostridia bacterium]|nr:phage scaffolding protein [Clostridia bacterium]